MSVWLWVVVAFVVGGLVGAAVTALLRRGSDTEVRLRRLRREYEQYQAEVARHFSQTGEFLSRLRTAFDQLYNEVEDRATSLVAEEAMQRRLDYLDNEHPGPEEVATKGDPSGEHPAPGGAGARDASAEGQRPRADEAATGPGMPANAPGNTPDDDERRP